LEYAEEQGALSRVWKNAKQNLFSSLGFRTNLSAKKAIGRLADKPISELVNSWPLLLELADSMLPSVFHKHGALAPADVDWEWLKQGIREMRERGVKFPAVHLEANGTISTGPVGQDEIAVMGDVTDPVSEVLFCDHSHTILVVMKTTWAALEAGKHFEVVPSKAHEKE